MEDPKAISVRQRLLNLARESGDDYNQVLTRYAGLRFLTRLAKSTYGDRFLLKGATMFLVWNGSMHRPTKDIDLLGFIEPDQALLTQIMQQVCRQDGEPDGLLFDEGSVQVEQIREETAYGGLRCNLDSKLGSARLRVQIDVGFGDTVTPEPALITLPNLLDDAETQTMRAYTPETVVAEKFEAMLKLGLANSRMKDYLDLDLLLSDMNLDRDSLVEAIRRTLSRRKTVLPSGIPLGLSEAFWKDELVQRRWQAFLSKNRLGERPLAGVCAQISAQLMPVLELTRLKEGNRSGP